MVRWINLGLAIVLAALLLMELTRSGPTEEPAPVVATSRSAVVKEKPARRARRLEARAAIEEARRQQRELARAPRGLIELDSDGRPFMD